MVNKVQIVGMLFSIGCIESLLAIESNTNVSDGDVVRFGLVDFMMYKYYTKL